MRDRGREKKKRAFTQDEAAFFSVEDKVGLEIVLLSNMCIYVFVYAQVAVLQLIKLQSVSLSTAWRTVDINPRR